MSLYSLTAGGKRHHNVSYNYMRKGKMVHVPAKPKRSRSKSRSRSRSRRGGASTAALVAGGKKKRHRRSHSKRGGVTATPQPYGAEYFQDYAQVGGASVPSFYDNYAAYADPRAAGAYDMYYDAADPRMAGYADYAVDPRYGGAPLAPIDPYADWTQARYAGADGLDYGMQAPLIGAGEADLYGGYGKAHHVKAYKRAKAGQKKKTVSVKATHSKASKRGGAALVAGGKRKRRRSRSRRGGVNKLAMPAPLVGGYDMYPAGPLVGGYDPYTAAPLVGGFDYAPVDPLVAGGKRKYKKKSVKVHAHSAHKPGKTTKYHVKMYKRSKSRSRSRSRHGGAARRA